MSRGPIVITGASGFLGHHLSAVLVARGWSVRGLVRRPTDLPAGVEEARIGGLDDAAGLRAAMQGAEAVVHLAARVHVMRDSATDPMAEHQRVNVEGTRALALAAADAGVSRFVFASSVKAVTGGSVDRTLTPETEPQPDDPYGITKLEAERVVRSIGEGAFEGTCILRLPAVYGPGMRGNVLRLFGLVNAGIPVPVGAVDNCRSLLYVGNFTGAVQRVLERPATSGTYYLRDDEDVSTAELVRRIARALGKRPRMVRFTTGFLAKLGGIGDRVVPIVRPGARPSEAFNRLLGSLCVDDRSFRDRFDFEPLFSMDEALAATAAWYLERKRSAK